MRTIRSSEPSHAASRIRFVLWQLMAMVASVACLVASGVAFAAERVIAANVLTGWAVLYGAPS